MKAKIKVQSIQVQYYFKDAKHGRYILFWSIRKRDTLLLSELNGIVYNFNANFDYYGPIIKIKRLEQYQKFKFYIDMDR
jgi:hypothetical protein